MTNNCPKPKTEAEFQSECKKWLKSQGCEVFKMTPGAGIPDATEDLFFIKEGFWGCWECKKSKNAPLRPGQAKTVERHNQMSYSKIVYPENIEAEKKVLGEMLK